MLEVVPVKLTGKIAKRDDEKFLVFGWASMADVTDSQGDIISIDTPEKAAYDFVLHIRIRFWLKTRLTSKKPPHGRFFYFSQANRKFFLSRVPQFIFQREDFFCPCRPR